MLLRLDRLVGLRIELSPGWYELPSHLDPSDRLRLQRLLADALGCAFVLECDWDELPALPHADLSQALLHLTVPARLTPAQRDLDLRGLTPRLGLFTTEGGAHWPQRAWDELDVKSALASWLRRSLRAPTHPLAHLGLAALPLDDLLAATAEPIELLHLVEAAIARVAWQLRDGQAKDWSSALTWSIGRRLTARLLGAPPELRPGLARAILGAPDGALARDLDPPVRDQLARLGLALVHNGDAALLPLARAAAEARSAALLELAQLSDPPSRSLPTRMSALSAPVAEPLPASSPSRSLPKRASAPPPAPRPAPTSFPNEDPPLQARGSLDLYATTFTRDDQPLEARKQRDDDRSLEHLAADDESLEGQHDHDKEQYYRDLHDQRSDWFSILAYAELIDLRPLATRVARFADRLVHALHRDPERARVVALMRHRSGANTTIEIQLDEAQHQGLWSLTAELPEPLLSSDTFAFADILLACARALLEFNLGDGQLSLLGNLDLQAKTELVRWSTRRRASFALPLGPVDALHRTLTRALRADGTPAEPPLSDAADTFAAALATLHRLRAALDRDRPPEAAARLHAATPELLDHLIELVQATQDGLAARGARLCLRITGLERLTDPARIDALVLSRAAELAQIPAALILGLPLAAEYAATATRRVSEVFPAPLTYAEVAAAAEEQAHEARRITEALLAPRVDLARIFGEAQVECLAQLAEACGGIPIDTRAVAFAAAERAAGPTITPADLLAEARARATLLAALAPPITAQHLEALDAGSTLPSASDLHSGRLLARDRGGWALHPLLRLLSAPQASSP